MQEGPRFEILKLLKRADASAGELSLNLGISATRQHLPLLEREGLIKRGFVKTGLGRPKILFPSLKRQKGASRRLIPSF